MRQGSRSRNANGQHWMVGSRSQSGAGWGERCDVGGLLFEQVNLGMIGVPPASERAREYIDLCLIKNGGPGM